MGLARPIHALILCAAFGFIGAVVMGIIVLTRAIRHQRCLRQTRKAGNAGLSFAWISRNPEIRPQPGRRPADGSLPTARR